MEGMGVAPKQKDKARQVFLRSAKQAGLLELAADRLTPPPNLSPGVAPSPVPSQTPASRTGGCGGAGDHPFIQGLVNKLPDPDSEWDLTARAKWLTTAANIFDLMYQSGPDTGIWVRLEGGTLSITTGETK